MRFKKFISYFTTITFLLFVLIFSSGCIDKNKVKSILRSASIKIKKILKLSYEVDPDPVDNPTPVDVADGGDGGEPEVLEPLKTAPNFISSFGQKGVRPGEFNSPMGIVIDYDGNIYISDMQNCRVQKFTSDGVYVNAYGKRGSDIGELDKPYGLAIWNEYIFIADNQNSRVVKIDTEGQFLSAKCNDGDDLGELHHPTGLSFDLEGNMFISDSGNHRIIKANYEALENNQAYSKIGAIDSYIVGPDNINNPWNTHFPKYNDGPNTGQFKTPWFALPLLSGCYFSL